MKFAHAYSYKVGTGAAVSDTFLSKIAGLFGKKDEKTNDGKNAVHFSIVGSGEASCEVSVEELKELFAENKESMDLLYDWIKNGKLKAVTDGIIKMFVDAVKLGVKEGKALSKEIMSDEETNL